MLGLGLASAGAVVATGALGPLSQLAPTVAGASTPKVPTLPTWQSLVGQQITVTEPNGHRQQLVLRTARALREDPLLRGTGYALTFRGARHPVLPHATSTLSHPAIGQFRSSLFPICKPGSHQSYQLVVDERRPTSSLWRS